MKQITFINWSAGVLGASLVIWLFSFFLAARLPSPAPRPAVQADPLQTPTNAKPFSISLQGHTYAVTPQFDYHIVGLVVSKSDAMGWSNISHRDWGDYLNTNDLCVVWGDNASLVDLREFDFTHGDWTCYFQTRNGDEYRKFRGDQFSNNHVLPSTPALAAAFRDVRIGDQISIDGQLVDYSIDSRGTRHTSTVRTDTGNGACEIIYVTDFKFLERHNPALYRLAEFARDVCALALLSLLFAVFVWPFLY